MRFKFNRVVGNVATRTVLCRSLINKSFPNYSIFAGPSGTGKSFSASITAMRLVCDNPKDEEPCGVCASCKGVMGVIERDAKFSKFKKINIPTLINKGDVNNLIKEVFKIDTGDETCVYIFEEVHELDSSSQTALLEELDRMPNNVYVILCTNHIESLIDPLKDRATIFRFNTLSPSQTKLLIDSECEARHMKIDSKTSAVIQNHSKGVPRRVVKILELLQNGTVHSSEELSAFLQEISNDEIRILFKCFPNSSTYIRYLSELLGKCSKEDLLKCVKTYLMEMAFLEKGVSVNDSLLGREDAEFAKRLGFNTIMNMYNEIHKIKFHAQLSDIQFSFIKCSMIMTKSFKDKGQAVQIETPREKDNRAIQERKATIGSINTFSKVTESNLEGLIK